MNLHPFICLETGAWLFEEFDLLGCGFPPEDFVSVRIAPETVDDLLVFEFEFQGAGAVRLGKELHRLFVDGG